MGLRYLVDRGPAVVALIGSAGRLGGEGRRRRKVWCWRFHPKAAVLALFLAQAILVAEAVLLAKGAL